MEEGLPLPPVPSDEDMRNAGFQMDSELPDAEIDTGFTFEPAAFDMPEMIDVPVHTETMTRTPSVPNVTDITGDLATLKMDIIDAITDAVRLG